MNPLNGIKWLANKASRDTSSGQFIPEIDGLRFIAIMSVFLFHIKEYVTNKTGNAVNDDPLSSLLSHGHIGVQLFFIISGFVIALPYARGNLFGTKIPPLKQFFIRRLTRLEPPYFINLFILFILIPLVTPKNALDLIPNLFASLTYSHNIIFGTGSLINIVAWSLEVELQFYVLAPFLTYLYKIQNIYLRRGIVISVIITFSILNIIIGGMPPIYQLSMFNQIQYFFTGFLLLDIYLNEWQQSPNKSHYWDVISVVAWFACVVVLYLGKSAKVIIVVPMLIAYCAAFKGTLSNRFFCHPLIYTIGGMCYTIYLYHYTVISAFGRFVLKSGALSHMPLWTGIIFTSIILTPITLLICAMLFVSIEKPCMKREWYLRLFNWNGLGTESTVKERES